MKDLEKIQTLIQERKQMAFERYFDSMAEEAISYRDFIRFLIGTDAIIIGAFLGISPLSNLIENKYVFSIGVVVLALHALAGLVYSAQVLSQSPKRTETQHNKLMIELHDLENMNEAQLKEWSNKRSSQSTSPIKLYSRIKNSPYTWTMWFLMGMILILIAIMPKLLEYLRS